MLETLWCLAFAGSRAQFLTGADHRHTARISPVTSVLCARAIDFYLIAQFHCGARPAAALQSMRRAHFPTPVFDGAVGLLHVDVKPDVRIRPFDFRDIPLHCCRLVRVKFCRERVVCDSGYRHGHTDDSGKQTNEAARFIVAPPVFELLLNCCACRVDGPTTIRFFPLYEQNVMCHPSRFHFDSSGKNDN